MTVVLRDEHIVHAISNIRRRSERQEDLEKLRLSFVDVGILEQLRNNDNQIIYGRRGTGKTHVLRVLASTVEGPDTAVSYIDFRTLGSTAQFSDESFSIRHRCTCLFRDILEYIHGALLEYFVTRPEAPIPDTSGLLEEFADAAVSAVRSYQEATINLKEGITTDTSDGIGLAIGVAPKVDFDSHDHHIEQVEKTTATQVTNDDKVIFP